MRAARGAPAVCGVLAVRMDGLDVVRRCLLLTGTEVRTHLPSDLLAYSMSSPGYMEVITTTELPAKVHSRSDLLYENMTLAKTDIISENLDRFSTENIVNSKLLAMECKITGPSSLTKPDLNKIVQ